MEGPARCAATATGMAERRAGSYCAPTWASSWSCRYWHALSYRRRLQQAGEALYAGPDMGTVEAALARGLETAQMILATGP